MKSLPSRDPRFLALAVSLAFVANACSSPVATDGGTDVAPSTDAQVVVGDGGSCPLSIQGMACSAGDHCYAPTDCQPTTGGLYYACYTPPCSCDTTGHWNCNLEHAPCRYPIGPLFSDSMCQTLADGGAPTDASTLGDGG